MSVVLIVVVLAAGAALALTAGGLSHAKPARVRAHAERRRHRAP